MAIEKEIPDNYIPSEDEEYMCEKHLLYFKKKLLNLKKDVLNEFSEAASLLKEKNLNEPDLADRASDEIDVSLRLRTQERSRKLVSKIDDAIARIERREYGYCEETGEEIGLKRLEARPIATLCISAQERHEKFELSHNEDE